MVAGSDFELVSWRRAGSCDGSGAGADTNADANTDGASEEEFCAFEYAVYEPGAERGVE